MTLVDKVNPAAKLGEIDSYWNPHIVGDVNDMQVKLVKLKGEFQWHHHDVEDELFLVVRGTLLMKFRDRDVTVEQGEFIIVPHTVEHCPVALGEECHVLLFEPSTTLNTGTEDTERTRRDLRRL